MTIFWSIALVFVIGGAIACFVSIFITGYKSPPDDPPPDLPSDYTP
ncbi:hypothetical protein [Asticcacaulis solisilvae]